MNKDGSNSDYALEFLRFMAREDQLNTPASVKGVPSIAKNAPDERYSNLNSIEKVEASTVCDGSVAVYVGSCFVSSAADLAGGVTVTLEDDFSSIDPAMTKGTTLTLWGDQAETYVRSRRSIGVGTNEARMARQEQYIGQLSRQLDTQLQEDRNFILTAYDALEPYLCTNIPRGQLANEAWAAKDYQRLDTLQPKGTHQVGEDGFMEFYPEAASLQQAVLQLFYEKVE